MMHARRFRFKPGADPERFRTVRFRVPRRSGRARVHHVSWSLNAIEPRLATHVASDPDGPVDSRAAVAAVLRFTRGAPDVLLMQRARREGDRWSGQVSFPGGRAEPQDRDLQATAVRETLEELGLDLSTHARLLGRMDGVRAMARGGPLSMTVTPYVFVLERDPVLSLSNEAEATFWFPLERAAAGELDALYRYGTGPNAIDLPCWRYEERMVWGMTHGMLRGLIDLVQR